MEKENVLNRFIHFVKTTPYAKALFLNNHYYSYLEIYNRAVHLASRLSTTDHNYCVIFANQSLVAYVGILAAILANKTYVPITSKLTVQMREAILRSLGACDIIVDAQNKELLSQSLQPNNRSCRIFQDELPSYSMVQPELNPNTLNPVYLVFTSGTTGKPKGIEVPHHALNTYIENIILYYGEKEKLRVLQMNDLTFDLSLHELFYCWGMGGCLYAFSEQNLLSLPKFIKDLEINSIIIVPSVIALLKGFRSFQNIILPHLHTTIFAGEALPQSIAAFWHLIAPNSTIDNLYGPTEATVLFTISRWDVTHPHQHNDIVPIGKVIDPNAKVFILDEENKLCDLGEPGEIALSGAQVVDGYWQDLEQSQKYFIKITEEQIPVYKTGDLGYLDPQFGLIFKGRKDDQLQIRGVRAERIEIESAIRALIHCMALTILPVIDLKTKLVKGFFLFVVGASETEQRIMKLCKDHLPSHMVPESVIKLAAIPINKNGKVNNLALEEIVSPIRGAM